VRNARLQLPDASKRDLPLVIVRPVPVVRSRLVSTAMVDAKVRRCVVRLVPVHVVNEFVGEKRTPESPRHNEAMLPHAVCAAPHRVEQIKVGPRHSPARKNDVTLCVSARTGRALRASAAESGERQIGELLPNGTGVYEAFCGASRACNSHRHVSLFGCSSYANRRPVHRRMRSVAVLPIGRVSSNHSISVAPTCERAVGDASCDIRGGASGFLPAHRACYDARAAVTAPLDACMFGSFNRLHPTRLTGVAYNVK